MSVKRFDSAFGKCVLMEDYATLETEHKAAMLTISTIMEMLGVTEKGSISEQVAALLKQHNALAVENTALKEQTPDVRSACMFEAIEKAEKFMDEGMPELAMVEAFEILKIKRTPATDAIIASIHADGVEKYGNLTIKIGEEEQDSDVIYAGQQALLFASQLRKESTHD